MEQTAARLKSGRRDGFVATILFRVLRDGTGIFVVQSEPPERSGNSAWCRSIPMAQGLASCGFHLAVTHNSQFQTNFQSQLLCLGAQRDMKLFQATILQRRQSDCTHRLSSAGLLIREN
jgi:hypothetical protein